MAPHCLQVHLTGEPFHQDRFGYPDEGNDIDLVAHFGERGIQCFSLGRGAGEAIEDGALFAVRAAEAVFHHLDGDIIWYQLAFINVGFCQFS